MQKRAYGIAVFDEVVCLVMIDYAGPLKCTYSPLFGSFWENLELVTRRIVVACKIYALDCGCNGETVRCDPCILHHDNSTF